MEIASRLAVAYAMNALWQLPLLVLVTEVMVRLLGWAPGKVLHRVWLGCLFLALTVPAFSFLHMPSHLVGSGPIHGQMAAVPQIADGKKSLNLSFSSEQFESPTHKPQGAADLPGLISGGALLLYLGSVLFAVSRLAWGLRKTQTLLDSAVDASLTKEALETWESCLSLFGITRIKLMSSSKLGGPATVSWPDPVVLLPAELQDEQASDMTAVFCHELAHVRRKDFLCNIFIEMLGVLIFYHPAFHWIRRRIQETRELACHDMAADAMSGRKVYACSLLRLTQKMLSAAVVPQPGCALGIFEGEVLEKRIMNLLENRSKHSRLRVFTSLAIGSCLLLGTCVLSANLGLKPVHAQSANQTSSAPAGWFLAGSKPANYQTSVDKEVIQNGQPSVYLKSIVPVTDGFGTLMQQISASDYLGKRVRLRALVRSQDVGDWAGLWMRVDKGATMVAFDNMQSRAIKGTQPWKQCDIVLDVPEDATGISFGVLLWGSGEVWMNDVSFEVVGKDVPLTSPATRQGQTLPTHPTNLNFTE
jgi:beta-lactamase regulating signal transducer with metallopeptidase domain